MRTGIEAKRAGDKAYRLGKHAQIEGNLKDAYLNYSEARDEYKEAQEGGVHCEKRLTKIKQKLEAIKAQQPTAHSVSSSTSSQKSSTSSYKLSSPDEAKSPLPSSPIGAQTMELMSSYVIDYSTLQFETDSHKRRKTLGSGGFGTVYKGQWQHTPVAIKELHVKRMTPEALEEFKSEVKVMVSLRHLHVMELYGVSFSPYSMVLRLMPKGSLYDVLHSKGCDLVLMSTQIESDKKLAEEGKLYLKLDGSYISRHKGKIHTGSLLKGKFSDPRINVLTLSESISNSDFKKSVFDITSKRGHTHSLEIFPWVQRVQVAIDMSAGLSYLHSQKIIHRDLKSLNVLLDDQYRAKIADFGLSRVKRESSSQGSRQGKGSAAGSLLWMAPELFLPGGKHNEATDVYALGMTLWELTSRELPFQDAVNESVIRIWVQEGRRPMLLMTVPEILRNLIQEAWLPEASARPSAHYLAQSLTQAYAPQGKVVLSPSAVTPAIHTGPMYAKEEASKKTEKSKSLHSGPVYATTTTTTTTTTRSSKDVSQPVYALSQNPYGFTGGVLTKKDEDVAQLKAEKEVLERKLAALELKEKSSKSTKSTKSKRKHKPAVNSSGIFKVPRSSSPIEQVVAMAQDVSGEVRVQDLKDLWKWVTEGHLVEVENLLKKNPKLALATGTIKDLSDRTFNNITVFQYAAWALDMEMCGVVLEYLEGPIASVQLKALEDYPTVYSMYSAHYDFTPLMNQSQTYLNNYSTWDYEKCCNYWQKEVGGAQRQCPAWLICAWCEEGKEVAWVKQDFKTYPVSRQYSEAYLRWWFTGAYREGIGVGSKWACVRGGQSKKIVILAEGVLYAALDRLSEMIRHDHMVLQLLTRSKSEQLKQLRRRVDQNPQSTLKK